VTADAIFLVQYKLNLTPLYALSRPRSLASRSTVEYKKLLPMGFVRPPGQNTEHAQKFEPFISRPTLSISALSPCLRLLAEYLRCPLCLFGASWTVVSRIRDVPPAPFQQLPFLLLALPHPPPHFLEPLELRPRIPLPSSPATVATVQCTAHPRNLATRSQPSPAGPSGSRRLQEARTVVVGGWRRWRWRWRCESPAPAHTSLQCPGAGSGRLRGSTAHGSR
jgi:hypothetical protein